MSTYYPIFLYLHGKSCLVVGGGEVALGKVKALLEAGADLTLVAPTVHPGLFKLANKGVTIRQRPFEDDDLDGVFLVIAATDNRELNAQIHALCEAAGILVNVVDDTPRCNFILPSIAKEGPLQVAVSSSGTSPTLARQIRQRIQTEILSPELGDLADFLGAWRAAINPHLPSFTLKKAYWQSVMRSNLPKWLQAGNVGKATAILKDLLAEVREAAGLDPHLGETLDWENWNSEAVSGAHSVGANEVATMIGGSFEHR